MKNKPPEWLNELSAEFAEMMAQLFEQEYRFYEGAWWLFSLGKPARPLREEEIEDALDDGLIPETK